LIGLWLGVSYSFVIAKCGNNGGKMQKSGQAELLAKDVGIASE
jgi:hypothetical protein